MSQTPVRCLFALWIAMAAPAWAEDAPETETQSPEFIVDLVPSALSKAGVRVYAEETISVLADFGPADASKFNTTLGVRAGGPLSESIAVRANAVFQASLFDYDGNQSQLAADLGGIDLFDQLYEAQFGLGGAYRFTPIWSVFAEGRANLGWENGASLADAISGSGAFGVGFDLEPHLEVLLGVSVGSKIYDGGAKVAPVFGFRWRIRDGMRLESQGLGLLFAVDVLPHLELQLRGSYETERYRLDDAAGPFPEQTVRQYDAPVLVALRWHPTKHWRFTVAAGSVVYQKWKVEADDDDGGSSSVDAGPAALASLRVEYRF